jgi:type 1 fimbria pilin
MVVAQIRLLIEHVIMKQSLSLVAATFLLAGATNLLAASAVDLNVKGAITPSACTPSLSAGGVVDHGKISIKDLPLSINKLPKARLALSVSCEAATLMAVKPTDNRAGTAWSGYDTISMFGLGLINGNLKLGAYSLVMENIRADGAPAPVIESVDGQTWFPATLDQYWQPRWMRSVGAAGSPDAIPVAVQTLATDLLIDTVVRKPPTPTTEEILIDGSASLDIVYL